MTSTDLLNNNYSLADCGFWIMGTHFISIMILDPTPWRDFAAGTLQVYICGYFSDLNIWPQSTIKYIPGFGKISFPSPIEHIS